jgi:hypothetical protein
MGKMIRPVLQCSLVDERLPVGFCTALIEGALVELGDEASEYAEWRSLEATAVTPTTSDPGWEQIAGQWYCCPEHAEEALRRLWAKTHIK